MSQGAHVVDVRPGFAVPRHPPREMRDTPHHRRMVELFGGAPGPGSWRLHRERYFDRFRWVKLRWLLTRRHFALRLANFLVYLLQRGRAARVHYLPPVVNLELINACNLRCPGCTTGRASPGARPRGRATLVETKQRIDRVSRRALQLQLFQLGEPLLHPELFEVCAHAAARGLWTVVHSNLSLTREQLAARIVAAGLSQLVVSCDGATQETYGQYRVHGNVERVFANLRDIAAERRRRGTWHPWLTAKFLVFDHNWHEMAEFQERALAAGADDVLFLAGFCNGVYDSGHICTELQFDLRRLEWVPRKLDPGCRQLWEELSLDVDGAVMPCCDAYRDEDVFVDPAACDAGDLMTAWNHPKFRAARAFLGGRSRDSRDRLPRPCDTCGRTAERPPARAREGA